MFHLTPTAIGVFLINVISLLFYGIQVSLNEKKTQMHLYTNSYHMSEDIFPLPSEYQYQVLYQLHDLVLKMICLKKSLYWFKYTFLYFDAMNKRDIYHFLLKIMIFFMSNTLFVHNCGRGWRESIYVKNVTIIVWCQHTSE